MILNFGKDYLIGPFNVGPKSALFLCVALIRTGVNPIGIELLGALRY